MELLVTPSQFSDSGPGVLSRPGPLFGFLEIPGGILVGLGGLPLRRFWACHNQLIWTRSYGAPLYIALDDRL